MFVTCILYALFHDITNQFLFRELPRNSVVNFYKSIQFKFYIFFMTVPYFYYIQSYLINLLLVISLCLICFSFTQNRIKYAIGAIFFLGLELLQLMEQFRGTFDFIDILIYFIIILLFDFLEERKR